VKGRFYLFVMDVVIPAAAAGVVVGLAIAALTVAVGLFHDVIWVHL
jgi:hypothetical protein